MWNPYLLVIVSAGTNSGWSAQEAVSVRACCHVGVIREPLLFIYKILRSTFS